MHEIEHSEGTIHPIREQYNDEVKPIHRSKAVRKYLIGLIPLFLIIIGLVAARLLNNQSQDVRKDASTASAPISFTIEQAMSNWPITHPDAHEIYFDKESNTYIQTIIKDQFYWLRTDPASQQWSVGKIFENEQNNMGQPFPEKLDSLSLYKNGSTTGQVVTYKNKWYLRSSVSGPWESSGTLFANEQNTSGVPLPEIINTSTVFNFNGKLAQTVTQGNRYWLRASLDQPWSVSKEYPTEILPAGITPETHTAFELNGSLAEVITSGDKYWYRNSVADSKTFEKTIGANTVTVKTTSAKTLSSNIFGYNLVWPFPITTTQGSIQDTQYVAAADTLKDANFVRYPGGHWSEWYQWYLAIGPRENRPYTAIVPAKTPLPNNFGVVELLNLLESNGGSLMMTVNYQTSILPDIKALTEYLTAQVPTQIPSTWNTEQWRTQLGYRSESALAPSTSFVKVEQALIDKLNTGNSYTSKINAVYDSQQSALSIDGYGSRDGENDLINSVEYQKKQIKLGAEWVTVDKIEPETKTIYIRRSNPTISHLSGEKIVLYEYNFDQPSGYFAWLRTQPGYGAKADPYKVAYWEIGNEPFYLRYNNTCNPWMSCNFSQDSVAAYLERYRQIRAQIKSVSPDAKIGFSVESTLEFANETTNNSWTTYLNKQLQPGEVEFISPHFYDGFNVGSSLVDSYNLSAISPAKIKNVLAALNQTWNNEKKFEVEIIASEYALVHHENGALDWWKYLLQDTQKTALWKDNLTLSGYLIQFAKAENLTGANYWHMHWPGMLGKAGNDQDVYPFNGAYQNIYSTPPGVTLQMYSFLAANLHGSVQDADDSLSVLDGTGYNSAIRSEKIPALLYLPLIDGSSYKLLVINRHFSPQSMQVTLPVNYTYGMMTTFSGKGDIYDAKEVDTATSVINQTQTIQLLPGSVSLMVFSNQPITFQTGSIFQPEARTVAPAKAVPPTATIQLNNKAVPSKAPTARINIKK